MIPSLLVKKVLPPLIKAIANWLYDTFPGIEKIPMVVKYMEEENDADVAIKELKVNCRGLYEQNDLLKKGQEQLANELDELKIELEKWKKNA